MATSNTTMQYTAGERLLNAYRLGESAQVSYAWRIAADSFVPSISTCSITVNGGRDPWRAWAGTYDTTSSYTLNEGLREAFERVYTGKFINGAPDRPKEPEDFDTNGVKGFLDGIEVKKDR